MYKTLIDSINGNVEAQGVKAKFSAWMVMGSVEWENTSEEIKAYAYQAAIITGWSDKSLIEIVCNSYPFIDKNMAQFTIDLLQELKTKYPLEIIKIKKEFPKVILKDKYGLREI